MAQTKKSKDSTPRLQQQENLQLLVTRSSNNNNKSHNNSRVQSTSRSRSRNRDGPISKRPRVRSKSPVNDDADEDKDEKPSFSKRRCRDYDERGFCMRGDFCKYDHGSDPMVLDASSVLGLAANGAPALAATQSIPAAGSANFLNEPYNPEAPGIIDSKQINPHGNRRGSSIVSSVHHISQHQFWRPMPPPPPGSTSGSFIPSMNQSNRPRELVGVPTLSEGSGSKNSSPIINPDLSRIHTMDSSTTSSLSSTSTSGNMVNSGSNSHHHHNNSSTSSNKRGNSCRGGNGGHRGGFRWGYNKRMVTNESADKCTLEVRKIPPNLNTIANLNSHFSKFGSIVNLQVCYDGDPEAALVQFASHSEALAAHRCTEAVLNNRFIKVFWHSKDQCQQQQQQQQQQQSSHSSTNQGPGHHLHLHSHHHQQQQHHHHKTSYDSSLRAGAAVNGSLANDLKSSDQTNSSNSNRLNVKDRLGLRQDSDKNPVSTNVTSSGTLSRTVFNQSLLKKQYPSSTSSAASSSSSIASTTALTTNLANLSTSGIKQEADEAASSSNSVSSEPVMRMKEDTKKNKLLAKLELQKKRQNILVSCMQQQKRLIEKLQKAKTDKDKVEIRSTVEMLNKQIKDLESDIKKDAEIILTETAKLPSSSKINNKIQMEKELLDVEMDFYNELHKGASASDLHKKLQEIKIKAKSYCMNDIRSTKAMIKRFAEMKAALRDRNRQANHTLFKNLKNLRKVDRRTRKIFIEGIPEDDNSILLAHLSQSVEIESLESMPQGVLVTFKTRRDAEMALPLISTIPTKASWFDDVKAKPDESEIAHSPDKVSSVFESLNESDINSNNDESNKIKTEDESGIGGRYFENVDENKDDDDSMDEDDETVVRPSIKQENETSIPDELQLSVGVEDDFLDEDTEEEEGITTTTTKQEDETSSPDELELSIGIEDDLLEEEETEDEDESRAWRR